MKRPLYIKEHMPFGRKVAVGPFCFACAKLGDVGRTRIASKTRVVLKKLGMHVFLATFLYEIILYVIDIIKKMFRTPFLTL